MQGDGVDARVHPAAGHQGGQRGNKSDPLWRLRHVQRFDAEPVPCRHQPAADAIHHGDSQHADQMLGEAFTPPVVRGQYDLGVAARTEAVAVLLQFGAQLPVVVDAAIEADRDAEFVGVHRLTAAVGQVDDAQPPVPQHDPAAVPVPVAIRPRDCCASVIRAGHLTGRNLFPKRFL